MALRVASVYGSASPLLGTHWTFTVAYEAGTTIILILQMRKLKHREAKQRAQYHTATEPDLYPGRVQSRSS